ncbi:hypothetical protein HDV00_009345 [Rhizophlyctis rosea]|nr:hypothetical protein HDV00_009345 [Rhizophlyctis rosea]
MLNEAIQAASANLSTDGISMFRTQLEELVVVGARTNSRVDAVLKVDDHPSPAPISILERVEPIRIIADMPVLITPEQYREVMLQLKFHAPSGGGPLGQTDYDRQCWECVGRWVEAARIVTRAAVKGQRREVLDLLLFVRLRARAGGNRVRDDVRRSILVRSEEDVFMVIWDWYKTDEMEVDMLARYGFARLDEGSAFKVYTVTTFYNPTITSITIHESEGNILLRNDTTQPPRTHTATFTLDYLDDVGMYLQTKADNLDVGLRYQRETILTMMMGLIDGNDADGDESTGSHGEVVPESTTASMYTKYKCHHDETSAAVESPDYGVVIFGMAESTETAAEAEIWKYYREDVEDSNRVSDRRI